MAAAVLGHAAAQAAPTLVKVGDFDAPVHVTGSPQDGRRLFVVEQPGRVRVVLDGAHSRAAVPGHHRATRSPAASAACSRSPSRPTTRRAGASTSTSRPSRTAQIQVREYRARGRRPRRPAPAARTLLRSRHPDARTTTAASCSSGPTAGCGSAPATAAAGTTPTTTPRTRLASSARSSAWTRVARRRARAASRSACATRGASRSTARRSDLVIGDVGQDAREEIDFAPAATLGGHRRQLRLALLGGHAA